MPLQYGNPVYSVQGNELGYVNFLAVKRDTGELQHLVVRLKNSPFPNKVVPTDGLASVSAGRVALNARASDLANYPDFTVTDFVPLSIEDWNTFQRVLRTLQGYQGAEQFLELAIASRSS